MASIITLDSIKAEHQRLGDVIAQYEAQPIKWDRPLEVSIPKLDKGETWAGALITPSRREHIILMPPVFDPADWDTQMERAKAEGGEAPDRLEGFLLFTELRDLFQKCAHWLRERHVSDSYCAWSQVFDDGFQSIWDTHYKLPARVVRRFPL
jgi:hypothetical protein